MNALVFIPIIWQASRWREGKVAGDSDRGNSESAGYIEGGVQYSTVQYSMYYLTLTRVTHSHQLCGQAGHTLNILYRVPPEEFGAPNLNPPLLWNYWDPESQNPARILGAGEVLKSRRIVLGCTKFLISHCDIHLTFITHTIVAHIERHSPCIHPTQILHHRPLLDCFKLSQIKAFTKTYGTGMNSLG